MSKIFDRKDLLEDSVMVPLKKKLNKEGEKYFLQRTKSLDDLDFIYYPKKSAGSSDRVICAIYKGKAFSGILKQETVRNIKRRFIAIIIPIDKYGMTIPQMYKKMKQKASTLIVIKDGTQYSTVVRDQNLSASVIRKASKENLTFDKICDLLQAKRSKSKKSTPKRSKGERWRKDGVDYALWCIYTGDDEPSRFIMDPNDWLKSFKEDGMTEVDLKRVKKLFASLNSNYDQSLDSLERILKKYVSHKHLLKNNDWYAAAEKALFR